MNAGNMEQNITPIFHNPNPDVFANIVMNNYQIQNHVLNVDQNLTVQTIFSNIYEKPIIITDFSEL